MTSLLIALLLLAAGEGGDVVHVTVTLAPPVIPFHRQTSFTITVEAPADLDVNFPDMIDRFGGLNIYGVPEYSMVPLKSERVRMSETYILDPIFIGDYPLEPVTVTWGDDKKLTVPSPAVRVRPLTEQEEEAANEFDSAIAGPFLDDPPVYMNWRFWAVALALLTLAVAALIAWLKRKTPEEKSTPLALPWEVAYRRLQELDRRHLPEEGKYEAYYVDLSAILRYYIEDRFHLHAPERTTQEFLLEASTNGIFHENQEKRIAAFLRHCDLVKFARLEPTKTDMDSSFAEVLQFVDETVPQEPTSEDVAA